MSDVAVSSSSDLARPRLLRDVCDTLVLAFMGYISRRVSFADWKVCVPNDCCACAVGEPKPVGPDVPVEYPSITPT